MTPSEFYATIKDLVEHPREDAIWNALSQSLPLWMNPDKKVTFQTADKAGTIRTVTLRVSPDYLGFGNDSGSGYFRLPMWPGTAQKLADHFGCVLPTKRIVNKIFKGTEGFKIPPRPITQEYFHTNHFSMTSTRAFWEHNTRVEDQLKILNDRTEIVAGHKKDIVLTPKLLSHPGHVAIYGWHNPDGTPIQGLNYTDHSATYVDYSHGVRLVAPQVTIDDVEHDIGDVLRDPSLHVLLSDEGIVDLAHVRYG